jgi:putative phosphoserine phosphatase / 1-acylglycerol-3-phosphate O-acyltransferase
VTDHPGLPRAGACTILKGSPLTTLDTLLEEIRTGPSGPQIAAFFDFDGTLIDGYSAAALYSHRLRNFEIGPVEAAHTVLAGLRGPLSEDQFAELVERGIRGWAGRADDDLVELGERLFVQGIAATLFHDAWRLTKAHQRRDHTVVIATSATRFQAGPLARRLGVENLLCTELETEDGILTGRLAGRTLWGPGKIAAVQAFAAGHGIDLAASHGYANGDEDVPFLQAVGHPHPVNPQKRLAEVASARGWLVLNFRRRPRRLDPTPAFRTAAMYGSLLAASGTGLTMGVLNRDRRRGVDVATSVFGDLAGAVGDIKIEVVGQQHLWSHRPAVFFINHQSALIDLLVTSRLLRDGFTFVAKKEIAQVPVIGQLFRMADVAFLDRADRGKAIAALQPALDRLRAGTSVVIAPEGTRSVTPTVGPFKKGGFHLAMQAGVPIVPIVIRNAGEIMWRDAKIAQSGTIDVMVHPPIPTDGWTREDLDAAVAKVQQLYVDTLEDWPKARQPESGESKVPRSRVAAIRAGQNRRTPIDVAGKS